jgi:hypothetical protein
MDRRTTEIQDSGIAVLQESTPAARTRRPIRIEDALRKSQKDQISMKTIHERCADAREELDAALAMPNEHPDRASTVRICDDLLDSIQPQIDLDDAGVSMAQVKDYRNREILEFVASGFLPGYHALHYVGNGEGNGTIVARRNAGTCHLIVGYSKARKEFIVRGVLKERRPGNGIGYLCNGQAGRNAKQVAHFDESASIVPLPGKIFDHLKCYEPHSK